MKNMWMIMILVALHSQSVWAEDVTPYLNQAKSEVETANKLFEQTRSLLEGNPSPKNMETAISLLIQAGKLFEHAGSLYENLSVEYSTSEDAKNSYKAMQRCVDGIAEIKQRLNEGA